MSKACINVIYDEGKRFVQCGYCGKFEEDCDKIKLDGKPICVNCYEQKADEWYEHLMYRS